VPLCLHVDPTASVPRITVDASAAERVAACATPRFSV
jgi:hypothetical protein